MTPTTTPTAGDKPLPLDDVMLAMDVVDTLRRREDLAERELDAGTRETRLIGKLRQIYHEQGIEVPDRILEEGVAALQENRFVYTPPTPGLKIALARLYVTRGAWGKWAVGLLVVLVLAIASYQFVYLPVQRAQAEAEAVALEETLPAQMDALYNTIYEETKVQTAVSEAEDIRTRGKAAAREGDRAAAEKAVAELADLRDRLRSDYTLRVVNRPGEQSGFWTFPEVNTEATNYYIVVEAVDGDGKVLTLPVENEETGETEEVSQWGLRVPEAVYDKVAADKRDDGIIERNIVGRKLYGFLDVDYSVPVLGGAVTQW